MSGENYRANAEIPVNNEKDDMLGLASYAESLADFVKNCVTPTTIAVQGDWGSGKTSLLYMIENNLSSEDYLCIQFNTWQYSQFEMSDELSVTFLTCFLTALQEALGKSQELSDALDTIKKVTLNVAKRAALFTAGKIGGDELQGIAQDALDMADPKEKAGIDLIKQLKSQIEGCIREARKCGRKRIVVFIDDLDRLNPVKAVELLEVLKLFLDCEHCVYVLAVDTNVIKQGIVQKYGLSEEKSQAFFEKLIQLPFIMPVSYYNFDAFVRSIFPKDGNVDYQTDFFDLLSEKDRKYCITILQLASDKNPRAAKRIVNAFVLADMVKRQKQTADGKEEKEREKVLASSKILLALTCMQVKLEPDYYTIIDMAAFDGRFRAWLHSDDMLMADDCELQYRFDYSGEQIERYHHNKALCSGMLLIFKEWCLSFDELHGEDIKALRRLLSSSNEKKSESSSFNTALLAGTISREFKSILKDMRKEVVLECVKQQKEKKENTLWCEAALQFLTAGEGQTEKSDRRKLLEQITQLAGAVDNEETLYTQQELGGNEDIARIMELYENIDSMKFHYTYRQMTEADFLTIVGADLKEGYQTYSEIEGHMKNLLKLQDIFKVQPEVWQPSYDQNRIRTTGYLTAFLKERVVSLLTDISETEKDGYNEVWDMLIERVEYFFLNCRIYFECKGKGGSAWVVDSPLPALFDMSLLSSEKKEAEIFEHMEKAAKRAGSFTREEERRIYADLTEKSRLYETDWEERKKLYKIIEPLLKAVEDTRFADTIDWIKKQADKKEIITDNYEKERLKWYFSIVSVLAYCANHEYYAEYMSGIKAQTGGVWKRIFEAVELIQKEYLAAGMGEKKNGAMFMGVTEEAVEELQRALDNSDDWQYDDLTPGYHELTLGMVQKSLEEIQAVRGSAMAAYELGMLIGRHFDEEAYCKEDVSEILYIEKDADGRMIGMYRDYCCFEKREDTFLWNYYKVFVRVTELLRIRNTDVQELLKQYIKPRRAVLMEAECDFFDGKKRWLRSDIQKFFDVIGEAGYDGKDFSSAEAVRVKEFLDAKGSALLAGFFEMNSIWKTVLNLDRHVCKYFNAMGALIYRTIPRFVEFVEEGSISNLDYAEEELMKKHQKFRHSYKEALEALEHFADS